MFRSTLKLIRIIPSEQQGITGLETAIVLIAFVVVASVFSFAALSTRLFTTDKAKQTIRSGLSETQSTMQLKGSVVATASATGSGGTVSAITFYVGSTASAEALDLTPGVTSVRYTDNNQTLVSDESSEVTITGLGKDDGDSFFEAGEMFEVSISNLDTRFSPVLSSNADFTVEVVPQKGATLFIERRTPGSLRISQSLN